MSDKSQFRIVAAVHGKFCEMQGIEPDYIKRMETDEYACFQKLNTLTYSR